MTKRNELKPHIGIFGRRNYGKSSLINSLTGQDLAIVSDTPGTTTDPVKKTMELSGVGPVILVDTAGVDDEGTLGQMRIEKSMQTLPQMDLALILFSNNQFGDVEERLVDACEKAKVPYVLVYSQCDKYVPEPEWLSGLKHRMQKEIVGFSIYYDHSRQRLLDAIRELLPESAYRHRSMLGDIVTQGDVVLMVTPIDSSAPEGRMILPQVQVLRDVLDCGAKAMVCKETELEQALLDLKEPPQIVITDSQVFGMVSKIVPESVPLTSFSVVLARSKGLFEEYCKGTEAIASLKDGDRVLMLESCTHNVTCEDIGRVKLPNLLKQRTGKQLVCDAVSGLSSIGRPLTDYALVIQCGGCVVTPKQLASRLEPALDAGVPVSNYGMALAYLNGIFHRAIAPFKSVIR